jgi:hypothetical protein
MKRSDRAMWLALVVCVPHVHVTVAACIGGLCVVLAIYFAVRGD